MSEADNIIGSTEVRKFFLRDEPGLAYVCVPDEDRPERWHLDYELQNAKRFDEPGHARKYADTYMENETLRLYREYIHTSIEEVNR